MNKINALSLSAIALALLTACGGGGDGAPGAPGLNSLINVSDEAAGANCEHGGKKVTSGADGNANGVLDSTEVSATNYICAEEQSAELPWVHSTDTAVQAAPNTGYLADNVDQVTITLPANPTIGDVIQVTGVGAGGWKIAQNAGQTMLTHNLAGGRIGETWTARKIDDAGTPMRWTSVASSADGMKLVAAALRGHIYTSTDAGLSWTARDTSRFWAAVSSSADGKHLAAATQDEHAIYTSSDSGVSWVAHPLTVPDNTNTLWLSLASSEDGQQLAAVRHGDGVYLSTDWGNTWKKAVLPGDNPTHVTWIDLSADGKNMVAVSTAPDVYTSVDGGITWSQKANPPPAGHLLGITCSTDCSRLATTGEDFSSGKTGVYSSEDSGSSWKRSPGTADTYLELVASSSDGTRLLAAGSSRGQLLVSTDSGRSWTARDPNKAWRSVASSVDGTRLVAAEIDGQIHTSTATPAASTSVGTAGYISARQHDSVELQYVGHGTFIVRNSSGSFDIR